jgi:hypothetical protein
MALKIDNEVVHATATETIMQYTDAKRKNNIAKEFFTLGSIRR